MEIFRLPANDARFLGLTIPEVVEQILLFNAASEWRAEKIKTRQDPFFDDREEVESEIRTDEKARSLADTAHLTGDPEFDAIEIAETQAGDTNWAEEYEAYQRERRGG